MTFDERIADLKRREIQIFWGRTLDEPPCVELGNDLFDIMPDGSMRRVSCCCGGHPELM